MTDDIYNNVRECLIRWAAYCRAGNPRAWPKTSFTYRMTLPRPETFGPAPEPESTLEEYIESIVRDLPPNLKLIIKLSYLDGMITEVAAKTMRISEATLRAQKREAYAYILARLEGKPELLALL